MFWYLATPYRKFPGGLDAAWRLACDQTAAFVTAGIPVFSPIAHFHGVGRSPACGVDPTDSAAWVLINQPFMAASVGMIRLQAPGWDQSDGMWLEETWFRAQARPVTAVTVGPVSGETQRMFLAARDRATSARASA